MSKNYHQPIIDYQAQSAGINAPAATTTVAPTAATATTTTELAKLTGWKNTFALPYQARPMQYQPMQQRQAQVERGPQLRPILEEPLTVHQQIEEVRRELHRTQKIAELELADLKRRATNTEGELPHTWIYNLLEIPCGML